MPDCGSAMPMMMCVVVTPKFTSNATSMHSASSGSAQYDVPVASWKVVPIPSSTREGEMPANNLIDMKLMKLMDGIMIGGV